MEASHSVQSVRWQERCWWITPHGSTPHTPTSTRLWGERERVCETVCVWDESCVTCVCVCVIQVVWSGFVSSSQSRRCRLFWPTDDSDGFSAGVRRPEALNTQHTHTLSHTHYIDCDAPLRLVFIKHFMSAVTRIYRRFFFEMFELFVILILLNRCLRSAVNIVVK